MVYVFTADTLPVDQLLLSFSPQLKKQGDELYSKGQTKVEQSAATSALISVEEPPRPPNQVRVYLSGNYVNLTCTCPQSYGWGTCKHKAAALYALRDYLRVNPPSVWKAILDKAIQPPARRSAPPPSGNAILFSLIERGNAWAIAPYTLNGKHLPTNHGGDPDTIASAIAQNQLHPHVKAMRSHITPDGYPQMLPAAIAAANSAIGAGGSYGYWYSGTKVLSAVLAMLPGCLVFAGDEAAPLADGRIFVHDEPAIVELDIARDSSGLAASFRIVVGGRAITVRPGQARMVSRDPLWMLIDSQLFRINETGVSPEVITGYPLVRIPAAEENDFLEQYLLPLSENLTVRGDAVSWEELAAPLQSRVYLSERESDLGIELRFGYDSVELPYEKHLPKASTRRKPGAASLVRVARDPDAEQAAWQALSTGFGLKRGANPSEFLLRKSVAPIDFLLREVPKLAAAGFTVFGEEALTLARVNRNRPTISFNVSSGIDWFDVDAVVQFGEQLLPLKDLKRAIKRRERYVKLADGSLGQIPEEWAERYRHLFAFAEDSGDSIRLSGHHLALLDQALADADRATSDAAFAERRERLKGFAGIEPEPLPRGFVGELRPYQKSGYDWLHFLGRYGFGGCLADDMGTGKCLGADSLIYLNGTLQTAASIWERYAGPARFDGEGEWAEPTAPLTVNSIDERSGRIVQAQVRRLYRQQVREQLRTVRLEDGSSITITQAHRLLGRDGWTNELKPGDYVCVPSRLVWEGEPVDPDLVALLAWQIAEGSAQKSIPDFIMRADDASIRLFLRHMFDAEGSVMQGGRGIEFSSASETLIKQVSTLLRRLGIWMRVHPKQKWATNGLRIKRTYYIGLIGGSSARRYAELVGFGDPAKQARLDDLCALPCNTNVEGIPASEIVGELVATTGLPVRHLGMHNTVYLNGSQQFSRGSLGNVVASIDGIVSGASEQVYRALAPSKWTGQTLAAYAQLDTQRLGTDRARLAHLLGQEVHYCKIESVEPLAYDGWVYDLEIEQHHNFVAEGMLCHNTIQTLAYIQSIYEREPKAAATLIVMPRSLLFNWQREAAQFTPDLRVYIHADQGRIAEAEGFSEHDLVLTTYGVMLRDVALLRSYNFRLIILDESQAIKNPMAETSRAARLLQAEQRLALTGTPIENSTLELWSQFAFLNPGLLGNLDYFREEFANPIERKQDDDSANFLRKMVFPFILRRTKDQVALDLPPRSEELLIVEMEPAQRKLYAKTRDYYRSMLLGLMEDEGGMNDARMKILEGLLRLRQICNHPRLVDAKFRGTSAKFELLLETLDTLRAEGHKALIFSQFVQMLTIIREALDARAIPYAYLDGSTRDRQAEVDRFQSTPELPFFLISLKAGGVGLNLTAADYVIHVDPWWNPAVEMQATDRTHRIGQTKPVFVYKLITKDTVEEKILKLQDQKRALVAQIISAEGGVFKSLTRDDVEVLFT